MHEVNDSRLSFDSNKFLKTIHLKFVGSDSGGTREHIRLHSTML
jgi:hypothetical protein